MGALDGVKILDLSWGIAGPLGVMLLAEQGADVVKVEPPGGDPFRAYSGYAVWNRSRRSVTIDLKSAPGARRSGGSSTTPTCSSRRSGPASPTASASGTTRCTRATRASSTCSCPGYPEGHRLADRPGYDALVQASSGQQWEQPGWRMGPIFLHMPMPSMGACFLIPSGILAALDRAGGRRAAASTCTTSLFQGALLYTTQIWQHVEKAPAAFHDLMGKSYPPGIHQQMLFEVAGRRVGALVGDERAHPDEEPGRAARPRGPARPDDVPHDGAGGAREVHRRRAGPRTSPTTATSWSTSFQAHNHAIEAVITMEEALGEQRARRIPSSSPTAWSPTVDDPELGRTTQIGVPINLHGTPGAIQGPQPLPGRAQPRDPRRARLLRRRDRRRSREERSDGRARRRPAHRLRSVPRGPVRPDDHRRPRRRGDQGRAGHRRRHAARGQAVLRLPARQARHRARPQDAARPRDRARADRAGRHRPPQHDRRRREQARHRLRRLQAREPRRRVLQHVGVRPRGSARALRRPRPAVPGGGRARVRGRRGAHRQRAALLPLRDVRRGQRDALGRRLPRRAVPPARAPARARSCGRRCSTAARCSRPTRCSSTARRSPGRGSTRASTASTRATGSTRPRTAGSRSRR